MSLLLVGLGNPGAKYENNRHNIGFMAIDTLVQEWAAPSLVNWQDKFFGKFTRLKSSTGNDVAFLKPQTYMNESGKSVAQAAQFYKFAPQDIVVFYDELDLSAGKMRHKLGGGAAGHNGIRSLQSFVGDKFHRIRLGIGHPGHKSKVLKHVLGDFGREDEQWLRDLFAAMAKSRSFLLERNFERFQTEVMRLAPAPR